MSFSAEIKTELISIIPTPRHCQLAEIATIIYLTGIISDNENNHPQITITTENEPLKRKYFTLLEKAFNIEADIRIVLQAIRLQNNSDKISTLLLKNTCCRRAYLRTAFVLNGSMSNPQAGYHLEFVFGYEQQAKQLKDVLTGFSLDSKILERKKYYVVYVKEGASIVDLLNIMGAHNALLRLENLRVEKEVRNLVNRKVNCEAANINKTVTAAARQIEDIMILRDTIGFASLSDNLREIAKLRIEYPHITLQELGGLLTPPIGKSGVNHRLRKLSEIANKQQNKVSGGKK